MRHSGSVYSRPTPVPKMPPGLVELMEGLSKDVLKHNPPDVYEFCANHMQKLLEIRDGPSQLKPVSLDRKIKRAQEIIRKRSEQYFRNKNDAVQEKNSTKVLNAVHHDSDIANASEIEISCQPAQTVCVVDNTKEINESNEPVQNSFDQNNKIVQSVLDESTPVIEAKVDQNADDILKKVSVETEEILSNKDVSIGNFEESAGNNAVEEAKLDLSGDIIIKKDAEDALLRNEYISVGNIKESVDTTELKEAKLDQSSEDIIKKNAEGVILPNTDVSNENIKETVDTSAVVEPKLDQSSENIMKKDAEVAIVSSKDVTVEESEDSKPKENTKLNAHEKEEKIVDQYTEKVLINLVSQGNIKEDIIDIQNITNDNAVDDTQHKATDDLNSIQNEVVIKYSETEDDAENNSGVEIYITDDSDPQPTQIHNAVTKDKGEAEPITDDDKNSQKISNLTVNEENLQTTADSPLFNDNVKPPVERGSNSPSIEKLVKSEQKIEIENATIENPKKEEESLNLKKTVFNVQDNCENSEQEFIAVSHKNGNQESDSNIVNDIKDTTADLNGSHNNDKHRNKREIVNEEMEVNLKNLEVKDDEGILNEEFLGKKHILPLSEVPQNFNTDDSKINQVSLIHLDDPSDNNTQSTAGDIDSTGFTVKEPLKTSDKQVSEEDVSDHSGNGSLPKSDMMSHDNLQTEIVADIKEHLEQMVHPKLETGSYDLKTLEAKNTEKVDGTTAHVDDSATEETNSINSVADGGTTDHSDETVQNDNTNTMDLESAAVTIQKVFRTFLFKSRASTFDESANDENNLSDDDNDDDNKDPRAFLPQTLSKDRRTLGISRMDSVLQTVNEEKSLSLSTDDSSTLSSAATVIQAHVRGFLARNKLHSGKTASSTNSLINSDGPSTTSLDGDDQHKSKTILNIHIVPEGNNFLSRDESMITSMDLSLDGSPPSSVNLHPLGYDKISERRKQLKREDAIQSVSPPSNNSGKLSEDVESIKELPSNSGSLANASLEQETAAAIVTNDDINEEPKKDSVDTTPTNSITVETVIEVNNTEVSTIPEPAQDMSDKAKRCLTKQSSDEMDVVTPYRGNTPRDSDASSGLLHSGEFHDTVLPTKVSRSDTPVVSEFKNVLVYFLLWNNS